MPKTDRFRRQHDQLLEVVGEITSYLNPAAIDVNASDVARLLARLSGKLRIHLAMEDESLYPRLLKSSDPRISATADEFIAEMGTIGVTFKSYMDTWGSASYIKRDPNAFISDTKELFSALGDRINRENNELYPIVDRM